MPLASVRCPECGARIPGPDAGFQPGEQVVCQSCATYFHIPGDAKSAKSDHGAAVAAGTDPSASDTASDPPTSAVAGPPKPKAKKSSLGGCLLGCFALGLVGTIILVAAGVGVYFGLGAEFVDDLLTLARQDQTPPKPREPRDTDKEKEQKPEPKELPERLLGAWTGDLPTGKMMTVVYHEKGDVSVVLHRPGKEIPQAVIGTWKVTSVENGTLRVHREFKKGSPPGDAFAPDVSITFPAANEMDHSFGKGTIRCRREMGA